MTGAPPAAAFVAMAATPFLAPGGRARRGAAAVVVAGLAATSFDRLRAGRGPVRAGLASAAVLALGWTVESVGVATGRPFGRYAYTGQLHPTIGGVPAVVPLAWFAMAAPAREAAHAALGSRSTPARRVVAGAAALTAWDLFLDPQMVREGYWTWARPGRYRGIPLTNFLGWFLTSAAAVAVLEATVPAGGAPDAGLVGQYAGVAAMETLGFATFFGDRTVAVIGGAAMLPIALAALWRVRAVWR